MHPTSISNYCTQCPTAPNPPTDLTVIQVTETSVLVSWTPPTNATGVTGYQIFYTGSGESEQSREVIGANIDMETLPGLTTGNTYSITIVATSDGLPSEVVGPVVFELGMRCTFIHGNLHMHGLSVKIVYFIMLKL